MAREPDMALFKTASVSLARRQILADIFSEYCKTANTSGKALLGYCWYRLIVLSIILLEKALASVKSEDFVVPDDTNVQWYGSHGNSFQNMRLPWLSQPKRFPAPELDVK